ncbi:hypothetical protein [Lacrimispora amygdalina]|nr:hypothetical protein [Clostridium indicum]
MDELKYYNSPISLEQAEQYIQSGLVTAARAYVANGYYLRRIRDDKLFEESGYQNFEDYVRGKYNKDKGWASKCIKVNQQLSQGGNSPVLSKQYLEYSTYQLVELAYMTEEQREEADPEMTVNQLKQIRKPEEAVEPEQSCDITTSETGEERDHEPDRTAYVKEQYRLKESFLYPFAVWLIKNHREWFKEDHMNRVLRVDKSEPQLKSYLGAYPDGSSSYGFPVAGETHYAKLYDNRIVISHFTDGGTVVVDGTAEWFYLAASVQVQWNVVALEEAQEERKSEVQSQVDSGYYNPDDEKEVDESYSLAGVPRASDRHVTMLARLFVQDNAKKLIYGGVAIGITDERIIEMLKLFYRSQKLIIIDNDVEVSVCAEIIEFSRDDEDLGICLFQKFANYVRKQIDEYVENRLAEKKLEENQENVIEQPENALEPVENVIDGEYVEIPPEQENPEYSPRYFLEEQKGKLDNYLRIMKGKELLPADIKFIECQKTIVAALACMVAELEKPEPEPETVKQEQPELPILKNNDQRAAFIDAYETWPIWIETKETGERYYRYDLSEKAAIAVKVYWKHSWESYKESKDYEYGAAQYYLLGVKSEWRSGKNVYVEDESRTFYECGTNRSALVEYLKDFQKSK